MDKFIDLPVSYFDPEFTLDPYPILSYPFLSLKIFMRATMF